MYSNHFIFNGHSSKEFGVRICNFDSFETTAGGEIEYNTVLAPNKDTYDFYGATIPNVLSWTFHICKEKNNSKDMCFSVDEERHLAKWLIGENGYKELIFDCGDYRSICYNAYFQMTPYQVNGCTIGYILTATNDSGYGYSIEYTREDYFNSFTEDNLYLDSKPIQIQINNDIKNKIYPVITIDGSGDFNIIHADADGYTISTSTFKNVNSQIVMDSRNDIITGLNAPSDFNWNFLFLKDGMNVFTCTSTDIVKFKISYREIRRVIV